jgi:hypothetical protein
MDVLLYPTIEAHLFVAVADLPPFPLLLGI